MRESVRGNRYDAYLEAYPKGKYAAMARAAKKKLTVVVPAVPATPSAPEIPVVGRTFRDCPTCPEMVVIPSGEFRMGSPSSEAGRYDDEGPVHRVQVKSFALGKTEVTRGQFRRFLSATGRSVGGCYKYDGKEWKVNPGKSWENPGYAQTDDHPVACVSWEDAQAYASWLSRTTGKGYRLASESEWEYAARGGRGESRHWGNGEGEACRYANVADQAAKRKHQLDTVFGCDDGYAETAPVGSFGANGFGLYDMLGNVWEWVEDCYTQNYDGAPSDGRAWGTGDCSRRVIRGGSGLNDPAGVRSAGRNWIEPTNRSNDLGFRIARTLP